MAPHRRGGVSDNIRLVIFSFVPAALCFQLSNPASTFPGDSLAISWTSSSGDPTFFDLEVGFCNSLPNYIIFNQPAIDTKASSLRHASIPNSLNSGLELPAACRVAAFEKGTNNLIASTPVTVVPKGSTIVVTPSLISTATDKPTLVATEPTRETTFTTFSTQTSVVHITSSRQTDTTSATLLGTPTSDTTIDSDPTSTTDGAPQTSSNTVDPSSAITQSESRPQDTATSNLPIPTETQTPATSDGSKRRRTGILVAEVLAGVLTSALLFVILGLLWWCRRRRRLSRPSVMPFVPDQLYSQRLSKRDQVKLETDEKIESLVREHELPSIAVDLRGDLERGNSVGAASVQEEVTLLRQRLMALEDQHRELEVGLRSAVIIPPQYSREQDEN
ncbi:hypothetical protein H0H87_000468 [Tephrocybe sp. NHM501043]|nr:hypothetical protein H0H87_000468 [Tephrocybe sp. NHM501043]